MKVSFLGAARALAALATFALLTGCGGGGGSAIPSQSQLVPKPQARTFTIPRSGPAARVCSDAPLGFATCDALRRTDVGTAASTSKVIQPSPAPSGAPGVCVNPSSGYTPCDLQAAYNLVNCPQGFSQTIAVIDAYDDPNAESDLAVYRNQFSLPACTTANGCFRKLNQTGARGNYTTPDIGWSQEISLDLDVASAICPNCHLMLVEGNTSSLADLATAVNTAVAAGATVVSNSYSGEESEGLVSAYGPSYDHPGVTITVASGDEGNGSSIRYPDDLNTVVSVGGTTLSRISPRTESAWSSSGSGCTAIVSPLTSQPAWQTADARIRQVCSRRTYSDVSADGDPNTGVDVYDSYSMGGWLVFGGTSVGAPLIAGVYALAGNAASAGPAYPYNHVLSINDVSGGDNGSCQSGLCLSSAQWDGPTGLGSPDGIGGF